MSLLLPKSTVIYGVPLEVSDDLAAPLRYFNCKKCGGCVFFVDKNTRSCWREVEVDLIFACKEHICEKQDIKPKNVVRFIRIGGRRE